MKPTLSNGLMKMYVHYTEKNPQLDMNTILKGTLA